MKMTMRWDDWNAKNRELYEQTLNHENKTCQLNPYRTKYLELVKPPTEADGGSGTGIIAPDIGGVHMSSDPLGRGEFPFKRMCARWVRSATN